MLLLGEDAFDHLVREIAVDGGELFVVGRDLVGEDHLKGNHEFGKHFWENLAVARLLARKLNRPIEPKRAPLTNDLKQLSLAAERLGATISKILFDARVTKQSKRGQVQPIVKTCS